MKTRVLVDAGPLIAFLNDAEQHHSWAVAALSTVSPPLLTCEAVISEACFVLERVSRGPARLLDLCQRGLVDIPFRLGQEVETVQKLMKKYVNIPASLADACLVRMSELYARSTILTLDSDFRVYRRHGRQAIPVIMPSA